MKRLFYLLLLLLIVVAFPLAQVNARNFDQNPAKILSDVHDETKTVGGNVQKTKLDSVTSTYCNESIGYSNFTITKTLCNIKMNITPYLEYVMYIGLSAATIFLIRNGFLLVTASDRSKQIGVFKKNFMYVVIGVILLVSFYYIIDIFLSVVNLISR